ncbi:MAG: 6-bladed beta-propeller, partial [bacterium]|nr:6-bladed beta-propeller [bacterium]
MIIAAVWMSSGLSLYLFGQQTVVENTLKEINTFENKVKLTLVRIWGDDEVDDENQFFRFPMDIKIGKDGLVYIVDSGNHRVQVFDHAGNFKRALGEKGKGPQGLLRPCAIAFDKDKNLVVSEMDNHRIQFLDPVGRYLHSFKTVNAVPAIISTTRKNELAAYSFKKSFNSGTLITLYTPRGKIIREIGKIQDKAKSLRDRESHFLSLDNNDNFFISYYATPYYRKYSYDGKPVQIVTYEVPFKAPGVNLNESQNEPKITGQKKGRVCSGLSVDELGRVFLVAATRPQKKSERFFLVSDGPGTMRRAPRDIET